jgi:hypothetical protein
MTTPVPYGNGGLRSVPPRPRRAPLPQPPASDRRINNKLNVKFSPEGLIPPLALHLSKTTVVNAPSAQAGSSSKAAPGSDFNSNEDIRAFANYIRKEGRDRAAVRAMDAEALETILRMIPDSTGSMAGARMRARRVSRWVRKIAAAEKLIAKCGVGLHAAFEKEFEVELSRIARARPRQPNRSPFTWN